MTRHTIPFCVGSHVFFVSRHFANHFFVGKEIKEFLEFLKQHGQGKALITPNNNNKQFDMQGCLQRSTMTWQFIGIDQEQYTVTFHVFHDGGVAHINGRWTVSSRNFQWALAVQRLEQNPQPFDKNDVIIDKEEDNNQKNDLIRERVCATIGQFLFAEGHTVTVYTGPGKCMMREKRIMWHRMQKILGDLIGIDVSLFLSLFFLSSFSLLPLLSLFFLSCFSLVSLFFLFFFLSSYICFPLLFAHRTRMMPRRFLRRRESWPKNAIRLRLIFSFLSTGSNCKTL